jgi:hypothetical protein
VVVCYSLQLEPAAAQSATHYLQSNREFLHQYIPAWFCPLLSVKPLLSIEYYRLHLNKIK